MGVVRVHDECIGSDVFGSDICSCRPYLIFALRQAVECAQRGGVGVVVYFRKEGRSLGEVIKFRVYNARINQVGGDRADTYFHHTESIAGIRDARFQTMMPDVLNWMGIRRIDWLCSMSNEKYEAITGAGIKVMQRVDLPEDFIKRFSSSHGARFPVPGGRLLRRCRDGLARLNIKLFDRVEQLLDLVNLLLGDDLLAHLLAEVGRQLEGGHGAAVVANNEDRVDRVEFYVGQAALLDNGLDADGLVLVLGQVPM